MLETEPGNVTDDTLVDGSLNEGEQSPKVAVDPQLGRSTRDRQPSTRYSCFECILLTNEGEPESFKEVQSHKDKSARFKPWRMR